MADVTKIEDREPSKGQQGESARSTVTVDTVDERQLVRQAQKGEKAAFEILVQRHQHRVFAVARGILKRQEDVEDVAVVYDNTSSVNPPTRTRLSASVCAPRTSHLHGELALK